MTPDELDQILSSEDQLEPSSGFTRNVMAAVRQSAAEPPPLAFPWFRFVAGLAASGGMAAAGTVLILQSAPALAVVAAPLARYGAVAPELGYAAAAVLVSLAIAFLSLLLARPAEGRRIYQRSAPTD